MVDTVTPNCEPIGVATNYESLCNELRAENMALSKEVSSLEKDNKRLEAECIRLTNENRMLSNYVETSRLALRTITDTLNILNRKGE